MILEIDAIDAIGANDDTYYPNDMSGNIVFFDLEYIQSPILTPPTGLSARGNYWGWLVGCGASIHDFNDDVHVVGSFSVPSEFPIDDDDYLDYPPTTSCSYFQQICGGATVPDNNGNTETMTTNFNLIYNISNDYLEEEEYNNALFGFSILADIEDEPVYDLLALNDQNTVILSKISQEILIPEIDIICERGVQDPSLLFPEIEIVEPPAAEIKLIETVSPNPFTDAIQLITVLKHTCKVEIFNAYRNLNGSALMQLKAETSELN